MPRFVVIGSAILSQESIATTGNEFGAPFLISTVATIVRLRERWFQDFFVMQYKITIRFHKAI